jgi:hypothetical protein
MSEDGSPAGGSQQDIDEQDRQDDEGEREQVMMIDTILLCLRFSRDVT